MFDFFFNEPPIRRSSLVEDFNTINAKILVEKLLGNSRCTVYVKYIENHNKDSIVTIDKLEGRNLPGKHGAYALIYHVTNSEEDLTNVDIGSSYIFSSTSCNEKYRVGINPGVLKKARPNIPDDIWDKFVLQQLTKEYKDSAESMYRRRATISRAFIKAYNSGIVTPLEYILEDPFSKEMYDVLSKYTSKEVLRKLNSLPIIDW